MACLKHLPLWKTSSYYRIVIDSIAAAQIATWPFFLIPFLWFSSLEDRKEDKIPVFLSKPIKCRLYALLPISLLKKPHYYYILKHLQYIYFLQFLLMCKFHALFISL